MSGTTDVANRPEFAARWTTKTIDGERVSGWFTEDFTLAELQTLRCKERLPQVRPQNTQFDGVEPVPTFDDALAVAAAAGVGVYPETKHPSYFESIGLGHGAPLLDALARHGFQNRPDRVFIQSFEVGNLRRLAEATTLPRVQLIAAEGRPADRHGVSYASMLKEAGLAEIAGYAAGVGLEKSLVLAPDGNALVRRAHDAGLAVHVWTVRAENYFLDRQWRRGDLAAPDFPRLPGDIEGEIAALRAAGVDGIFTDNPGPARLFIGTGA